MPPAITTNHFIEVYAARGAAYDAMVTREDYAGNLLPALRKAAPLDGAHVIEMGAGTGRLTRLIAPQAARVDAFDLSPHMLTIAAERPPASGHVTLAAADNRALPVRDACADVCIAGWSFGHATGWYPDGWQGQIAAMLGEMLRVLKPGGTAVILETLGTGSETPVPPNAALQAYYTWLENAEGFAHSWIRTDYRFGSLDEADALTRFFFGDALADRIRREALLILPECTGLWWRVRP
jgi:ubiquinone/menaquinone biosynthesis C-methylase UbiE